MNQVLQEVVQRGYVERADGTKTKLHSNISRRKGEFLQGIIAEVKPKMSLEVGLGYGVSALYICEALQQVQGEQHIVIDPYQFSDWEEIGIQNLARAGLDGIVQYYDRPSYLVLPELVEKGLKIDFAFIDGWHSFDYALLDFFYIDKLLNVGGVVVFDDTWMHSLRQVCRFIISNRKYRVFKSLLEKFRLTDYLKQSLLEISGGLPAFLYNFLRWKDSLRFLPYAQAICFVKEAEDHRSWNFHRWF